MRTYIKKMLRKSNLTLHDIAKEMNIPYNTIRSKQRRNAYRMEDILKIAKITNSQLYIVYCTGEKEELMLHEHSD